MLGVAADLWCEILPAFAPRLPGVLILACLRNKQKAATSIPAPLTIPGFGLTPEPLDVSHMWGPGWVRKLYPRVRTATQQRTYVSEYKGVWNYKDNVEEKGVRADGRITTFPHC